MKGESSLNKVTAMGSAKSAGAVLLLLSFLLYVADSYPNFPKSNMGCEECTLTKNSGFSRDRPIYQCMGCCFSRAYPTPLKAMTTMTIPKNITSEATCCVAKQSYQTEVAGIKVRNHTECHCSTCYYHKI
ncbi:glycoprotein hormones alpha chain [Takifugu rubripes]|uniref:Glycoprotein hormones alpha chain n=4 Tax=Takifugu TaxID=31032 RepID=H2SP41_TAKRU|nr:glycoprotein hormones alpha chain [Takifugu rubripes]XP_056867967.1 glycoprotein hormones alpha chain [Takifugu flavidus]TWW72030.1 Glycoprotein hormones alpha chain GTH-alpha [Takifugu flavidus]BAV10393.1 glycoprotein hormones subunit alpha precursor [Takifugu rubripes]